MADPLVSMICPTWNRPVYLRHAVELFLRQTWAKAELLVIDDSDEDKRPDLSRFSRVRHVKLEDRISLGEKHNIGHALAQGEVLGFWDDDDYFGPRRILKQLDPIVMGTAEIVGFKRGIVLEAGNPPKWWDIKPRNANHRAWIGNGSLAFKIPIHDGSAVYSRSILRAGVRFPHRTMNEKVDFLNAAVEAKATWTVISNAELFVYVRHGKNTWQYREDMVHTPAARPTWFPDAELDFYRKAVA